MTITKGYVGDPGAQIHFRQAGSGDPLVIFHMTASSSLSWEPVLRAFANRGFAAYALDTPGFGNSDHFPERAPIQAWAERLLGAMSLLGLDQPHVVGHHTGATIASLIAADHPDRVRKLAMWGFTAWPEETMARNREDHPRPFSEDGHELLDRWNAWKRIVGPRFTPEMGMTYVLEILQAGNDWNYGHMAVAFVDHFALARRVQVPTLIICGDRDMIWPECHDCVSLFPNAESTVIAGGGVDIFDQHPDEFADRVGAFFSR